jgi:endonuclease/exonuclease/phosphatase family metal-dependent hydrolase
MKISKNILVPSILGIISVIVLATVLPIVLRGPSPPPVDDIPPYVYITNPVKNDICSDTVIIECYAEDNGTEGGEISRVEFYIDNVLKFNYNSCEWDTTQYDDGYHMIKVKVFDKANNTAEDEVVMVVDNFLNSAPTDEFKILSYNVFESGHDPEWKDVVKAENPDIAVFVETGVWDNRNNEKLNNHINEFNGYFYEEAPYKGYTAQDVTYSTTGEAIMSRYPILEFNQIVELILDDNTTYNPTHDFIHAVVDVYGKEIHIIGLHLKCCAGDFEEWRREREQEGIINYMDELGDVPLIYIGDMNCISPDDVGLLAPDPAADFGIGPTTMMLYPNDTTYGNYSSKVHTFIDTFRYLNPNDPGYTLHVPTLNSRIDYIFVNQHFNNSLISSNVGTGTEYDDLGSDHYTVDLIIDISNVTTTSPIVKQRNQIDSKSSDNSNDFYLNRETLDCLFEIAVIALLKENLSIYEVS